MDRRTENEVLCPFFSFRRPGLISERKIELQLVEKQMLKKVVKI